MTPVNGGNNKYCAVKKNKISSFNLNSQLNRKIIGNIMNSLNKIFIVLAFVSISFIKHANAFSNQSNQSISQSDPISYAQQVTFESKILGSSQQMNIYLPEDFEQSSAHHTYPVIFITDGHGMKFFHALTGIVKHLSEVERMPKSIIVSLNDTHAPEIFINDMWVNMNSDKFEQYGQPELYIRHLKEELFPFLKEEYRANDYRTIIGVSGSSLFPLSSFVQHPKTFTNYLLLASQDMIGMGLKQGHSFIDEMAESLSKGIGKREYLYLAQADSDLDGEGDSRFIQNLEKLEDKLSTFKDKGFTLDIETIANENHYAAFLKAMMSAFENIYPQKLWAPEYRKLIKQPGDAMTNIDAFYQSLSAKYGFEVLPNADRWNNVNNLRWISGKLIRDKRINEAIFVAQRWSLYQPNSLSALSTWAEALDKLAKYKEAVEKYQQLVQLATEQKSERLPKFKLALENIQNKLHN